MKIKDLKESNGFLNTLLDNVNSLIFVIDQELKVVRFNEAFRMFIYKQEEEMVQEFFGDVVNCGFTVEEEKGCGSTSHCHLCEFNRSIRKTFETGQTFKERVSRTLYLRGKEVQKHFQFTSRPIDFQGEKMVLLIIDDITEMEEKKEKLKQLNKIKNRFLGTVSHDLKNPIGAIQSLAYLLLEEEMGEEQKSYVTEIYKTSEYMMRLVEDLLDIYKIETGNGNLKFSTVNYQELLQECADFHRVSAKEGNVRILLESTEEPVALQVDRNKILQTLNNLIDNAIKFSPPGSEVMIRGYRCNNQYVTEVKDQGPGILEEDREHIFQEFYQGNLSFQGHSRKSSGLGLAIAKEIVEAHHGEIGLESNREGTRFYYALPINRKLQG